MDALFIMKSITLGAFFAGGILGCALGTIATKILNKEVGTNG